MSFWNSVKTTIFRKGLSLDFPQNLKFKKSLMFFEKDLDMMFKNALMGKMGFLDNKHVILTQWENVHFSKGVNPWFLPKI